MAAAGRRVRVREAILMSPAKSASMLSPVDELIHTTQASPPSSEAPGSSTAPRTVRLQPTRGFGRVIAPATLWRFRDVAVQMAARDVKVRYRQTALGAAWAILQPVGTMVVFTIFFGNLAGVPSDGESYALFTLAALVPWTFFANALLIGSESLVSNSGLVSKIYFPRIFIPAGVIAAGLVDLAIAFCILMVIVVVSGTTPDAALLAVPALVAMAVAAALGVASALAAVNVRYRDVKYMVPFAVQLWLFATPVAYPSTLLSAPWRTLSALNPMVGVVEGFRWALLGVDTAPGAIVIASSIVAVVLLVSGAFYFRRMERTFADVV
jgi:lipopolysaccharide transport system permease protein